ncbi:hypothetical protein [Sorangium sp. So ce1024]|uniref:hypothetical protein n=1 Tax=unclassified Sorangium TaxID=2621164 RepID=UPI003F0A7EB7
MRDSVFNETVLWSGRPKVVATPLFYIVGAVVCGVTSAICTASAIVVARALNASPTHLLAFAAWMASLAVAFSYLPRWWRSELEYLLTDRHIVVQRGKLRRSIERRSISYARIHWHPKHPGVGDLELVRAVPTGALRRRLSIVLNGVVAPDRVWAILRGVVPSAPAGDGHRLLSQRLDEGERVLWSAHPADGWHKWLPSGLRGIASVLLGVLLGACAVMTAAHAVRSIRIVTAAGMDPESVSFVALVASLSLTIVLLVAAGAAILYASVVRPARLAARTRYLITDRRVLIQRGDEELHLDRSRIVDVIDAPGPGELRDVFLVLDGPRARAVAVSGAFGEAPGGGLQPVLRRVTDVESVRQLLKPA